jgi:hypothetical protein
METNDFADTLHGGDLRSLREPANVLAHVRNQHDFDALFTLLFHHDRNVVMRAADAVEKITRTVPDFLDAHRDQLLGLMMDHANIELKWHLAQLAPRLEFGADSLPKVWARLRYWILNRNESKLVRVNALQGLFEIMQRHERTAFKNDFRNIVAIVTQEHIPSIDARIRKLRRQAISTSHRQN